MPAALIRALRRPASPGAGPARPACHTTERRKRQRGEAEPQRHETEYRERVDRVLDHDERCAPDERHHQQRGVRGELAP